MPLDEGAPPRTKLEEDLGCNHSYAHPSQRMKARRVSRPPQFARRANPFPGEEFYDHSKAFDALFMALVTLLIFAVLTKVPWIFSALMGSWT